MFHAPKHFTHVKPPVLQSPYGGKPYYALLSMEQPKYAKVLGDMKYIQENFDLLLTYSLSPTYPGTNIPNLPITYYPLNILSSRAVLHDPRPFQDKHGYSNGKVSVAAFVSNCIKAGANERQTYIRELMKLVEVHSYGSCLNNMKEEDVAKKEQGGLNPDKGWPEVAQRRARKVKLLSRYKFYLALENSPVDDYVSEKIFEGFFSGSVPIYRGAPTIHKFVPSNSSFINANNLTPKQLATMIKKYESNEEEYNKFFAYKKEPLSQDFKEITLMSYNHPNVLCRLCDHVLEEQS